MNNIITRDPVIKLNKVLYQIVGLVIIVLTCGSSLTITFIPSIIRVAMTATTLFLFVVVTFRRHIYTSDARCLALISAMLAFVYINGSWAFTGSITFTFGVVLCLFSIRRGEWINMTLDIMEFIYLFYAASTIFVALNPDFYRDVVVKWYPGSTDSLINLYESGCYAGLTNHYSTNAMLISVGIILSSARLFTLFQTNRIKHKSFRRERIYRIIVISVLIVGLLLTGKRAHIVFVAASLLVMFYSSMINTGSRTRLWRVVMFVIVGVLLFSVIFTLIPSLSVFIQRFASDAEKGDLESGRGILWRLAWNTYRENPIFGIGWYNYSMTLSQNLGLKFASYHVHNVYLQLLCETGTVGFLVYMTWFIVIFRMTVKNYRRLNFYQPEFYTKGNFHLKFSLGFQIFFFMYCITGNPLYDEETFLVYFICCAISLYYNRLMKDYLIEKRIQEELSREKKLYEDDIKVPQWIKWL